MKQVKLYNVIFPIWLLLIFPPIIFAALPLNFVIDFAAVYFTLKYLKIANRKELTLKSVFKVWGFGFLADFVGGFFMLLPIFFGILQLPHTEWFYETLGNSIIFPYDNIWSFLWVAGCVLISAFCIYFFNKKISFCKLSISEEDKKKVALSLAIFTAPYLFLISMRWFPMY